MTTRAGRAAWPGFLVGAWLLAFGLSRGAGVTSASLPAAAASLAAAFAAVWLLPGWLLARRLGLAGGRWWETAPVAFGLGLAWLLVPASAVLLLGLGLRALVPIVLVLEAALVLAEIARPPAAAPSPPPVRAAHPALWVAILLSCLAMGWASAPGLGFTASGDDWTQMAAIRAFLDAPAITDTLDFDAWDLVLALLVRLGGPEVVDAYRLLLPPLLLALAVLSFHLLARTLADDANFARWRSGSSPCTPSRTCTRGARGWA